MIILEHFWTDVFFLNRFAGLYKIWGKKTQGTPELNPDSHIFSEDS